MTDGSFKFTYPDGKAENIQAKSGDHLYFAEQWEHLPENLSDKPCNVVYIELKP